MITSVGRKGSHGAGEYALPGGHLEVGESWEQCAVREVLEETGLRIQSAHFVFVTNNMVDSGAHYVTIFMRAAAPRVRACFCSTWSDRCMKRLLMSFVETAHTARQDEEPQLREPAKCEGWQWCSWPDVPRPVFGPLELLLRSNYEPDKPCRTTSADSLAQTAHCHRPDEGTLLQC